jgi:hypothetical protein
MAAERWSVVASMSGPGMAGQCQVPSTSSAPPLLAWMPSWSMR